MDRSVGSQNCHMFIIQLANQASFSFVVGECAKKVNAKELRCLSNVVPGLTMKFLVVFGVQVWYKSKNRCLRDKTHNIPLVWSAFGLVGSHSRPIELDIGYFITLGIGSCYIICHLDEWNIMCIPKLWAFIEELTD